MTGSSGRPFRYIAMVTAITLSLSACGTIGDTADIKKAGEYAIDCQPDKALAALEKAQQAGGLGAYLAELEKIVFLQDAGREQEAAAALQSYHAEHDQDSRSREETEKSIQDSLKELRDQRFKKTGQRTCT
jgi:hypothetical protein